MGCLAGWDFLFRLVGETDWTTALPRDVRGTPNREITSSYRVHASTLMLSVPLPIVRRYKA